MPNLTTQQNEKQGYFANLQKGLKSSQQNGYFSKLKEKVASKPIDMFDTMEKSGTLPITRDAGSKLKRLRDTLFPQPEADMVQIGDQKIPFGLTQGGSITTNISGRNVEIGIPTMGLARKVTPKLASAARNMLHPEDIQTLKKFIDGVRLEGTPDAPLLSDHFMRSVEDMFTKLGISLDTSVHKLTRKAEDILTGQIDASSLYKTGREFKPRKK